MKNTKQLAIAAAAKALAMHDGDTARTLAFLEAQQRRLQRIPEYDTLLGRVGRDQLVVAYAHGIVRRRATEKTRRYKPPYVANRVLRDTAT